MTITPVKAVYLYPYLLSDNFKLMKSIIITVLFTCMGMASFATDRGDEKIYEFLNDVFARWKKKNVDSVLLIIQEPDFREIYNTLKITSPVYTDETHSELLYTTKDSIEITGQIEQYKTFKFKEKKLNGVKVASEKQLDELWLPEKDPQEGWYNLYKEYKTMGYVTISVPIFFDNGNQVVFSWGRICGNLCGDGYTIIYRKIDGKWKKRLVLNSWVS